MRNDCNLFYNNYQKICYYCSVLGLIWILRIISGAFTCVSWSSVESGSKLIALHNLHSFYFSLLSYHLYSISNQHTCYHRVNTFSPGCTVPDFPQFFVRLDVNRRSFSYFLDFVLLKVPQTSCNFDSTSNQTPNVTIFVFVYKHHRFLMLFIFLIFHE